ncbi:MAG: hypothetical protein JWP70_1209 [Leifsonia sp.]|nr:hypothetical protein [Leifsonia sp.]MDQ1588925.1 hypothetical protein [Microbacteriaceae bacterium]
MTADRVLRLQPLGDPNAIACEGDACLIPGADATEVRAPAEVSAPA